MPKRQTKIIFISLLVVDACVLAVFFTFFFMMKDKIARTIDQEDQITSEIKKEESLSLMKKDIEAGQAYESKLSNYVIAHDDVVGFIKILESMVASSNLKSDINSVTYESSSDVASVGAEYVRVKMDVTGEWKNIQFFLELLENYPLKIDVKSVSTSVVAYDPKSKKAPQWSGSFDFTVVKLKDI